MADYLTFQNIWQAVCRLIGDNQYSKEEYVKSVVNQVYLNEVLQCDNLYPLHWLHAPIQAKFHAAKTITAMTAANPVVVTSASHGFLGGEVISIWDVEGEEEVNFDYKRLGNISLYVVDTVLANTFELTDLWGNAIDGTGYTAYTSGGTILHHGWSVGGSALSTIIKAITDVSIQDGLPLSEITWKEFLKSPDTFISNSPTTPTAFINFRSLNTTGTSFDYALTFPGAQEDKQALIMIEATGQRLLAAGDVPMLPPQFHDSIVSGSVTRLAENQVQVENAVIWPGLYKMHIEAIKTFNRKWWEQHEAEMEKPYLL